MRSLVVALASTLSFCACDAPSLRADSALEDSAADVAPDQHTIDAPARDALAADAVIQHDARSQDSATGCADRPSLSNTERMLLELPADSWTSLPNTAFDPWCRSHGLIEAGQSTAYRCSTVINAWGGGAYDPDQHAMVLFGGGHNDYPGNEVYAFDIATASWRVVKEPTPLAQIVPSRDEYADRTPVSRHTYDGFAYITDLRRLFVWGGARYQDGSSTAASWLFDASARTWTRRADFNGPAGSGLYWMGTDYDRETRTVFTRTESGIFAYSVDGDAWRRLADFGYPPYYPAHQTTRYRRGIVLASRRLFYTLGGVIHGGSAPDVIVWNIQSNRDVTADWPLRGDTAVIARQGAGADYDSAADAIVAWSGGAPAILSLTDNTWTLGSSTGAPAAQVANGTYGRFRYVPSLNVFALVNQPTQNVYFYKHTAGCGR